MVAVLRAYSVRVSDIRAVNSRVDVSVALSSILFAADCRTLESRVRVGKMSLYNGSKGTSAYNLHAEPSLIT